MQVEFIVNGSVSLLLAPENDMEAALIKQLVKQKNDIIDISSTSIVLNKTFKSCVVIKVAGLQQNKEVNESETKEV